MFRPKVVKKAPRLVWRMTAENPKGEFVNPFKSGPAPAAPRDVHRGALRESSLDLRDGVELTEIDMSTLPGELTDELLKGSDRADGSDR